jgi:hypothetical protein
MVPEQILFQLWLPHLLFSRIHCLFFRPLTKTMNRGFTVIEILSELDHAVCSVIKWWHANKTYMWVAKDFAQKIHCDACPHTLSVTSVIRDITVYQMEFETDLCNDYKLNTFFINNTYWKDSGPIPGSSDAIPAISLRISDASRHFSMPICVY